MNNPISIKGTREGLTITLGPGEVTSLLQELVQHLATQGAFFRGGTVALQVGERVLQAEELKRFSDLLAENEMVLRTVVATNITTQQAVKDLGLRLVEPQAPHPSQETRSTEGSSPAVPPQAPSVVQPTALPRAQEPSRGVLVRHMVRSGQVIRHTGHVVIIGDVNMGAEVVAGGDVVVWGRLHGTVHAGAMGNKQAVVCALDLAPLQLRIGDLISRPAEEDRPLAKQGAKKHGPEVASVRDNMIVLEPWDQALRGG